MTSLQFLLPSVPVIKLLKSVNIWRKWITLRWHFWHMVCLRRWWLCALCSLQVCQSRLIQVYTAYCHVMRRVSDLRIRFRHHQQQQQQRRSRIKRCLVYIRCPKTLQPLKRCGMKKSRKTLRKNWKMARIMMMMMTNDDDDLLVRFDVTALYNFNNLTAFLLI